MAMPFVYALPGAEVEKVLDPNGSNLDREGNFVSYKWKPANPRRRGFIVKTQYQGEEVTPSDGIEYVLVKFEQGKEPEKCLPTQLNLVKVANEAALYALKNDAAIVQANNGLLDDMKKPIVTDQTGIGKTKTGKGLSKGEAEDLAKK